MKQQAITLVGVAYIGKKAEKRDTSFGTRLTFTPGQVHQIEAFTANRMLQHKDVYAPEDSPQHLAVLAKLEANKNVVQQPGPVAPQKTKEQELAEQLEALAVAMKKIPRKDGLATFEVTQKLGLTLDLDKTKKELEQQISDAYQAHVAKKLGIDLAPTPEPEPTTETTPEPNPVPGEQGDSNNPQQDAE